MTLKLCLNEFTVNCLIFPFSIAWMQQVAVFSTVQFPYLNIQTDSTHTQARAIIPDLSTVQGRKTHGLNTRAEIWYNKSLSSRQTVLKQRTLPVASCKIAPQLHFLWILNALEARSHPLPHRCWVVMSEDGYPIVLSIKATNSTDPQSSPQKCRNTGAICSAPKLGFFFLMQCLSPNLLHTCSRWDFRNLYMWQQYTKEKKTNMKNHA